jgi:predicted adenine nucleotide alpha hydrolase (AANH) superfamily ATPase
MYTVVSGDGEKSYPFEIGTDVYNDLLKDSFRMLYLQRCGMELTEELAGDLGVTWLPSDFKKKEGYKRSIELSAEYDLYRQDYCGCAFSKAQREKQKTLSE